MFSTLVTIWSIFLPRFYSCGPLDAQVTLRTRDPYKPIVLALLNAHLDLLVNKDRGQILVVEADEVVPVTVEYREHEYEQQRPMHEQIAVAFDLTAVLGVNVDLVGVEGDRREAEEHGGSKGEGVCVRGRPIF